MIDFELAKEVNRDGVALDLATKSLIQKNNSLLELQKDLASAINTLKKDGLGLGARYLVRVYARIEQVLAEALMELDDDCPVVVCPWCHREQRGDPCAGLVKCDCGFCTHPSLTGDVCDICGMTVKE